MNRLLLTREGQVARLTLVNPPHNALDLPLMRALTAAVTGLAAEPATSRPRLVVLASGVPDQFSQGVDPHAALAADVDGRKQIFYALGDLVEALWFCHIPLLADVSGPALAGGAVLATVADFAVVDAAAGKICFSEPKVGLPLPLFIQRLIQRKVNPSACTEVILLGRNVDAQEACRIGLANAAYTGPAERADLIKGIAARVCRLPPLALSETLRQGRAAERRHVQAFRDDLGAFAEFLTDDYLGKGLAAVLKGETPRF